MTDSSAQAPPTTSAAVLDDEAEWRVYDAARSAVTEQIDRQWSQIQFFILLNASVVAGGIALLQFLTSRTVAFLVILVFAGGFGLSMAAMQVMRENKRYYRTCVAKKTLCEARLGLTAAFPGYESYQVATRSWGALATTTKVSDILRDPDAYTRPHLRKGSVSGWVEWTLLGFVVFDLMVVMAVANAMTACWTSWIPCTPIP